jgi:THO complex subunit 5
MTAQSIITDPFLLSVLSSSAHTRQQCLDLLSETSSHPLRTTTSTSPDAPPSPPSASESTVLDLSKQQQALFSQLSKLRGLNRDAVLGVRETKQVTAEARQEVDRLHLQLQNLYYEQRHLSGEIAACESFEYASLPFPQNCPPTDH